MEGVFTSTAGNVRDAVGERIGVSDTYFGTCRDVVTWADEKSSRKQFCGDCHVDLVCCHCLKCDGGNGNL